MGDFGNDENGWKFAAQDIGNTGTLGYVPGFLLNVACGSLNWNDALKLTSHTPEEFCETVGFIDYTELAPGGPSVHREDVRGPSGGYDTAAAAAAAVAATGGCIDACVRAADQDLLDPGIIGLSTMECTCSDECLRKSFGAEVPLQRKCVT